MSKVKLCKNCNVELVGSYCFNCGQKNIENFTFSKLAKDFFDNILSLDSRLFQTLKFLIIRPGFLTNEYWSGKRITYLPPFRLYLLISIVCFGIGSMQLPEIYAILPYVYFVLMPCTALILLILYRKNNLLYFHHFITTLHLHSFMNLMYAINNFLLIFLKIEIESLANLIIDGIFLFIILIYIFIMLKNIYAESLAKVFIKYSILICVYAALFVSALFNISTYLKQL